MSEVIEWVLDTETTGLNPKQGHRVVEIGCVQLIDKRETGEVYHVYINPERDMPEEAYKVHGLSESFLKKHPPFKEIAKDFYAMIRDTRLVIHNAGFDMRFLNAEFERLGMPALPMDLVTDTLMMARKRFPGSPASLDALCKRFQIDNTSREKHGALLDAELLSQVYIAMTGQSQSSMQFASKQTSTQQQQQKKSLREPRSFPPTDSELEAHQQFISKMKHPLWQGE